VRSQALYLVDRDGQPFEPHIERTLTGLVARFCRRYPAFRDELMLAHVLETAARKIQAREKRSGRIEHLRAYAWVTLNTAAASLLRCGRLRMAQRTVAGELGEVAIGRIPATVGNRESVERAILLREVLDRLTPDERRVCLWKLAGHSSREIARFLGMTAGAIDTMLFRIKRKARKGSIPKQTIRSGS
jgi:RNA polymerase sigma factor (sigma-70 family)